MFEKRIILTGNLSKGIDNCFGTSTKTVPLATVSLTSLSLFQLESVFTKRMLAMFTFRNKKWKKNT